MKSDIVKDLKRIMGAFRCDALKRKIEKEKRAGAIKRADERHEMAMRFIKRRK